MRFKELISSHSTMIYDDEEQFECGNCSVVFATAEDLRKHEASSCRDEPNTDVHSVNGEGKAALLNYSKYLSFGLKWAHAAHETVGHELIAVACSDEDQSTHFPSGKNKTLKVVEVEGSSMNFSALKAKYGIKNIFFRNPKTKKRVMVYDDRGWAVARANFRQFIKSLQHSVHERFFRDCKELLQGSEQEVNAGLKMFYEAGNYPDVHDIKHLNRCEGEITRIIRFLGDAEASNLWMGIVLGLWAWSTTREMQEFLIEKGLLEYVSPGSEQQVLFQHCSKDVAKTAAGLLAALTTEPKHCKRMVEHGSILGCLDILEGPKGKYLETRIYLLQTIHHCLLEAEVCGNVSQAVNMEPSNGAAKHVEKPFVERLMQLYIHFADSDHNELLPIVAAILGILSCDSDCYTYFKPPVVFQWCVKMMQGALKEDKSLPGIVGTITGLGKCMWISTRILEGDLCADTNALETWVDMLNYGNSKVVLCALAALSCLEAPFAAYDSNFIQVLNMLMRTENSLCKEYVLRVFIRQSKCFPTKFMESDSVSHIVHIFTDPCFALDLRTHALMATVQILKNSTNPNMDSCNIDAMIYICQHEENLTLQSLAIYIIWYISSHNYSTHGTLTLCFTEQQRTNLVLVFRKLFQSRNKQFHFLSYVLVMAWNLSYDAHVQDYMMRAGQLETLIDVLAELHAGDNREPDKIIVIRSPDELRAQELDRETNSKGASITEDPRSKTCELVLNIVWVLVGTQEGKERAMQCKIYDTLLRLALAPLGQVSNGLQIKAAEFLRWLCVDPKTLKIVSHYTSQNILVSSMLISMMQITDRNIQAYVAQCVASLSTDKERQSFTRLGGACPLVQFLENPNDPFVEPASIALYNLSVCTSVQEYLCRLALPYLLRIARHRDTAAEAKSSAANALHNLQMHPGNRTVFYKKELQLKMQSAFGKTEFKEPSIQHFPEKPKPKSLDKTTEKIQNNYHSWFSMIQNVKVGEDVQRPHSSRRSVRSRGASRSDSRYNFPARPNTSSSVRRPRTARPRSPRFRPKSAGRRLRIQDELGQRMRQPTSRIWISAKSQREDHENPWKPRVHHYEQRNQAHAINGRDKLSAFGKRNKESTLKKQLSLKVILEPSNSPRSTVKFSPSGSIRSRSRGKLCMWKHIEGNRVSSRINLEVYDQPGGEKVHYYQHETLREPSSVRSVTIPSKPTDLSMLTVDHIPQLQFFTVPTGSLPPLDRHDEAPVPPPCKYDSLSRYHIKLKQEHVIFSGTNVVDLALDGHKQNKQRNKNADVRLEGHSSWLDESVFAMRPYTVACESYYEKNNIHTSAFVKDWNLIYNRGLFRNFALNDIPPIFKEGEVVEYNFEGNKFVECTIIKLIAQGSQTKTISDQRVTIRTKQMKQMVVHLSELRYKRAERGEEIIIEENMTISNRQFDSSHGCNRGKLKNIAIFTMSKIEFQQEQSGNHPIQITGHESHVRLAQHLIACEIVYGEVERILRAHHQELSRMYYYFRAIENHGQGRMDLREFSIFISDADIPDPRSRHCSRGDVRGIYEQVSYEGDLLHKRKKHSRQIYRYEFMEILIRLGYAKYGITGRLSLPSSFQMFIDKIVHDSFNCKFLDDGNAFRLNKLYDKQNNHILEDNFVWLVKLFAAFSTLNPVYEPKTAVDYHNKHVHMPTAGWSEMVHWIGFIDQSFTMRDAALCASRSIFSTVNDIEHNTNSLNFPAFLEAFCRMCDRKGMPDESDLRRHGVKTLHEYYQKKNIRNLHGAVIENRTTKHSEWMANIKEVHHMDVYRNRGMNMDYRSVRSLEKSLSHNVEVAIGYIKERLNIYKYSVPIFLGHKKYESWILRMYKTGNFESCRLQKSEKGFVSLAPSMPPPMIAFRKDSPRGVEVKTHFSPQFRRRRFVASTSNMTQAAMTAPEDMHGSNAVGIERKKVWHLSSDRW